MQEEENESHVDKTPASDIHLFSPTTSNSPKIIATTQQEITAPPTHSKAKRALTLNEQEVETTVSTEEMHMDSSPHKEKKGTTKKAAPSNPKRSREA